MDNNMSRVVMVVLGVALVVAAIFAFNQTNSLNETATELADAESAGTQLAEEAAGTATQAAVNLSDANASSTQSADNAAATGTQNAVEIADANASATQSSDDAAATGTQGSVNLDSANTTATQSADNANATERSLQVTGTRSAVQAVSDLYVAGSTATQAAENLATVQAEAAENSDIIADMESEATTAAENLANMESEATSVAANLADVESEATIGAENLATMEVEATGFADNVAATATQQANELADALATVAAITGDLASSEEMVSTLEADLDEANETIDTQATSIAAGADDNNSTTNIDVEDGFFLYETSDFSIMLPEGYVVFDLRTEQEEAIETYGEMGLAYIGAQSVATQGTGAATVIGVRDTPNEDFTVDTFLVLIQPAGLNLDMETFIDASVAMLPDQLTALEQDVLDVDGEDVGYVVIENAGGFLVVMQIAFVYNVDGQIYFIFYSTTEDRFDDLRPTYETSAFTFMAR